MVVTAVILLNETASGELRQRKQVPTRREAQQYTFSGHHPGIPLYQILTVVYNDYNYMN